jgi:hypothetical protein
VKERARDRPMRLRCRHHLRPRTTTSRKARGKTPTRAKAIMATTRAAKVEIRDNLDELVMTVILLLLLIIIAIVVVLLVVVTIVVDAPTVIAGRVVLAIALEPQHQ